MVLIVLKTPDEEAGNVSRWFGWGQNAQNVKGPLSTPPMINTYITLILHCVNLTDDEPSLM